ncbi:hypothetical protein V6N13_089764 [Hibiscus sabdariffa]
MHYSGMVSLLIILIVASCVSKSIARGARCEIDEDCEIAEICSCDKAGHSIKCPLPYFSDDLVGWNATSSGRFLVSSAYRIRHGVVEGPNEDVWKIISQFKGTQRIKIFLWMV